MENLEKLTDEQLIERIHAGEDACMDLLIERYKRQVRNQARALYLIGGDSDDLIQEGLLGLFKAIRDYRPDREVSFGNFAQLCITRQMYSAIQAAGRQKHVPLNSYVELTPEFGEVEGAPRERSPEELLIHQETIRNYYRESMAVLSLFERRVLTAYLKGKNYQEIAKDMQKSPKSVENALQRIRRKLRKEAM
jgi:RNA polymerase sporulation-specific sigma factor